MYWVKLILLDVLIIADFFGSTLIEDKIVRSVPEGTFPAAAGVAIWIMLFITFSVVIFVIFRRLGSSGDSS